MTNLSLLRKVCEHLPTMSSISQIHQCYYLLDYLAYKCAIELCLKDVAKRDPVEES